MKLVIQLLLWIVIIFLGYLIFNSIYGPIEFNKVKEARYAKVIDNLKEIRDAEQAHLQVTGRYTGSFDSLVRFIDTAQFVLVERRDTTVLDEEYQKTYDVDRYITEVIVDTIGFASVKDSLFKNSQEYKTMMDIPIEGVDEKIELRAGTLKKNENEIPVFEARVPKEVVLFDQPDALVGQEEQVQSVDAVNGAYISVGSLEEVNTTGNWPRFYDDQAKE